VEPASRYKLILEKILQSETFKDRPIYHKLLTYLFEASSSGSIPKEVTIAHDIFNKGKDFNASVDTTVRVHIHNLRKMIEQYYQTEGQSDEIKLIIPRGHYRVEFEKENKQTIVTKFKKKNVSLILLASALLCSVLYIIIDTIFISSGQYYFSAIDQDDAIWGTFFNNGYPTSIVIGDFLVFHEYDDQLEKLRRIQDYEINTVEELDTYIKEHPDKYIENWFLGELPHNSIFNIVDIQNVLLSFDQKTDINFTTDIDINFIKNRNIIYVGEFKNLRALSDLLSILPVKYETLPWWHGSIRFKNNDSLVTLTTSHDWNISRYVVDLAIAAILPGQSNEYYLIIAGFGYNSQIKVVNIFSHPSSVKKLAAQISDLHGHVPNCFIIVFEVTGFDRASTKAEIKFFQEINKNDYQKFSLPAVD
jgi:hypothetical protein